jgi:hypothetical protein
MCTISTPAKRSQLGFREKPSGGELGCNQQYSRSKAKPPIGDFTGWLVTSITVLNSLQLKRN